MDNEFRIKSLELKVDQMMALLYSGKYNKPAEPQEPKWEVEPGQIIPYTTIKGVNYVELDWLQRTLIKGKS